MIIYGALLSPFVRKVCVAAHEKGIAYEMSLKRPWIETPGFAEASPFGKIPAIRDGDYTLADSSAICAYLDAKHPAPALLPADPQARGKAVWFDEFADTMLFPAGGKILFNRLVGPKFMGVPGDEAAATQGEAELVPLWAYLETVAPAPDAHGAWLVGAQFTLGDIAVATMIRSLTYVDAQPTADMYPAIAAWYTRVCARPAWAAVAAEEAAKVKVPA